MPRMIDKAAIRQVVGMPYPVSDSELKAYVSKALEYEWDGSDLPSETVQVLLNYSLKENDELNKRHAALDAQREARENLPDYDALIAKRQEDPKWNTMTQAASKLGLGAWPSAFELLGRYGMFIVELEPDGVRVNQPSKAFRYGVWQAELDGLSETLAEEKDKRQSSAEDDIFPGADGRS